jgi:hypothetical protein
MADCICHFKVSSIQRSAGRSVTAAVGYRSAAKIKDERTGETFDYSRKRGVEYVENILPKGIAVKYTTAELWNAAEAAEKRKDAIVGREYVIALPVDLDAKEREELAVEFANQIVSRYRVAANLAIHEPGKNGDGRNYHAHIMTSTRELTTDGFGAKTRILDCKNTSFKEIESLRILWSEMANQALEKVQSDRRMDPRSFADRDIDRIPEVHLGYVATALERRGIQTRRGDANRKIREANASKREIEKLRNERAVVLDEMPWIYPLQAIPLPADVKPLYIKGYWVRQMENETRYLRAGSHELAFVDQGNKIKVANLDDETLLAALTIAKRKWGGAVLTGTEDYKRRCVALAVKHGVEIHNPELQPMIQREREKLISAPVIETAPTPQPNHRPGPKTMSEKWEIKEDREQRRREMAAPNASQKGTSTLEAERLPTPATVAEPTPESDHSTAMTPIPSTLSTVAEPTLQGIETIFDTTPSTPSVNGVGTAYPSPAAETVTQSKEDKEERHPATVAVTSSTPIEPITPMSEDICVSAASSEPITKKTGTEASYEIGDKVTYTATKTGTQPVTITPDLAERAEAGAAKEKLPGSITRRTGVAAADGRELTTTAEIESKRKIAASELQGTIIDRQQEVTRQKKHTVTLRSKKIEAEREDADENLSSILSGRTSAELKERYHEALSKLAAEVKKIAQPDITKAAKEFIKTEAKRIKTKNTAIYKEFCAAKADRDAHIEKEPPEPLFFGRSEWRREHERWENQLKIEQNHVEKLWTKAGGDMSLKNDDYGKKEVDKRLSDEYALEEA